MKYFTKLLSHNQPGNNLQRQALAVLKAGSNLLISDPEVFLAAIKRQIEKCNAENPRCRPLDVYIYNRKPNISFSLGVNFTVGFHIYPVKNPSAAGGDHAV